MLKLRRNLRKRQLKFPDRTSGSDGTRRCISSYIRTAIYFDQSLGFWVRKFFEHAISRSVQIRFNRNQMMGKEGEEKEVAL